MARGMRKGSVGPRDAFPILAPVGYRDKVKEHAKKAGQTLVGYVSDALEEFMAKEGYERPEGSVWGVQSQRAAYGSKKAGGPAKKAAAGAAKAAKAAKAATAGAGAEAPKKRGPGRRKKADLAAEQAVAPVVAAEAKARRKPGPKPGFKRKAGGAKAGKGFSAADVAEAIAVAQALDAAEAVAEAVADAVAVADSAQAYSPLAAKQRGELLAVNLPKGYISQIAPYANRAGISVEEYIIAAIEREVGSDILKNGLTW